MKSEYLIFNLIVILAPVLAFSLYRKADKPELKAAFKAVFPAAILFIFFDELATNYFWNFNPEFTLGFKIGKLPVEEILFFFTVPLACLFLWLNVKRFLPFGGSIEKKKIAFLGGFFAAAGIYFTVGGVYYTAFSFFLAVFVLGSLYVLKNRAVFDPRLYLYALFVNLLTFLFNLYLTARPVISYNPAVKTNFNILTIPFEDFLYGMALIFLVCALYEKYRGRAENIRFV